MKQFYSTFLRNLIGCFKGWRLAWNLGAVIITLVLVRSGFDWWYFKATDAPALRAWMFPAALIGFVLPFYLPLVLWLAGVIKKDLRWRLTAFAVAQAEILGSLISSAGKAFTGRAHPLANGAEDITQVFHFGILRGGMFWGWPSSHTTIAFAMAVTVVKLFPKQRWLGIVAVGYALYIGIGISMTIHWFSDFAAGTVLGTVIGLVVGESFSPVQTAARAAETSRSREGVGRLEKD